VSWSYSGNPASSDRDQVRFLIGDTNTNDQLVTNEEIDWALTEGGPYTAAAISARAISALFARRADFEVSKDLKVSFSKQAEAYAKLAVTLETKASTVSPTPYAGGISVDDKDTQEADTDRVKPSFKRSDFMDATTINADQDQDVWE
jgi:hypothetical protein